MRQMASPLLARDYKSSADSNSTPQTTRREPCFVDGVVSVNASAVHAAIMASAE
jgi:hypothetical protein